MIKKTLFAAAAAAALLVAMPPIASASSHREAPGISEDPTHDNTDLWVFRSQDKPDMITFINDFQGFQEPAGGPNFYNFSSDGYYEIKIDNDGDAIEDVTYRFTFRSSYRNKDTFLYNTGVVTSLDDPDLNYRQFYTLTKIEAGKSTVIGSDYQVAPANIGPRSTPNYDALANQAIYTLPDGGKVFVGPRDDPFFVDVGSIFDLLALRPVQSLHLIPTPGNTTGVDSLKGYNVLTMAIQVPINQVTRDRKVPESATANNAVIGTWSSASRARVSILGNGTRPAQNLGGFKIVSRLGMPLVNEIIVPVGSKDAFNGSEPKDDAQFLPKVLDPEVPKLYTLLYPGIKVPPAPRMDLVQVFLTGVPGLNMRTGDKPAEMIRINLAIPPTASPNRLGVLAGDTQGFPNGRRLIDDVVDIDLRVAAGVLVPGFNVAPNNALTDGVDANEKPFLSVFPYAASPFSGYDSMPHNTAK